MSEDANPDEPLVAELRALFAEVDPVPGVVTEAAKAALGWRRLDADLAELLSDSALQEESLALARGGGAPVRSVTFSTAELTIDLEIHTDGEHRTLLGQLAPPFTATIELQTAEGSVPAAETDHLGRFRVTLPTGGSIRLRVLARDRPSASPVETSWISV
jgi:hypothetical protein